MYEPGLYIDESITYFSPKHWYWLIRRGRKIYFDHPEADQRNFMFSASLDDEKQMEHFKAAINGRINVNNASGTDHRRGLNGNSPILEP